MSVLGFTLVFGMEIRAFESWSTSALNLEICSLYSGIFDMISNR